MKRYAFVLFAGALLLCSCKKGSSSKSNIELITASAWKYDKAAIDANQDGTAETPLPPGTLEDCDLDNVLTLNADGTGIVDEGATRCDAGDPQSVNITWSFKNNEKTVNIPNTIFGSISGDAEIRELTETKLQLSKLVQVDLGVPVNVIVVVDLKH